MKETLTNEAIRKLFKSNFALANQAIRLARFYIKSGHEVTLSKLLYEVKCNPSEDYVDDLKSLEEEEDA